MIKKKRKSLPIEVHPEAVFEIVKEVTGFNPQDNLNSRKMPYPEIRFLAMSFLRDYTMKSLSKIGSMFGRDHATVLHGCKCIDDWRQTDARIRRLYVQIDVKIKERLISMDPLHEDMSLHELLYDAQKANFSLLNNNIMLRNKIKTLPKNIIKQYFGDDERLYPVKQKNTTVAVV